MSASEEVYGVRRNPRVFRCRLGPRAQASLSPLSRIFSCSLNKLWTKLELCPRERDRQ